MMRKISLRRFEDGGLAMFAVQLTNHHIVIDGNRVIRPLVKNILRVCVVSYVMFARANSLDEHRPWASIMVRDAFHPQEEDDIRPADSRLICPTEEYAIRAFRSV